MFLPLDMRSWVPKDHFVWFLVDVVQQLDTSALEAGTSPGKGRPGYDPRMLATLVMYAMSCGERSSREIEDRTRTDAGFRIASAGQSPDHSTLCRFRQRTGEEDGPLEDLFTQVLYVCAVAGLGRLRVISVDGSKIWADAAKEANRTLEGLRKLSRKVLEEAAAADGECGCDGHGHGEAAGARAGTAAGAVPGGCCRGWDCAARRCCRRDGAGRPGKSGSRPPWRTWRPRARRRMRPGGSRRKPTWRRRGPGRRRRAGYRRTWRCRWRRSRWSRRSPRSRLSATPMTSGSRPLAGAACAAPVPPRRSRPRRCGAAGNGWPPPGRPQGPGPPRAAEAGAGQGPPGGDGTGKGKRNKKPPRPVRNITDPDSRAMHCTRNGTVQAYNCQCPRSDDGLVLAARATQDANDAAQVKPTLAAITAAQQTIAAGHRAGGHSPAWSRIGTVAYDAGYFSKDNCEAPGPDRLISPGAWESAESSGPHTPACRHQDPRDQMAHNLSTRQGRDIYRRRAPLSEGGFSFLKDRIGLRRFSMRGLPFAQAELTLAATVSNLLLLHRSLPRLP